MVHSHPQGGARRRVRARCEGVARRIGVDRRADVADEPVLRHAQHDRRRRAPPPIAAWSASRAPRGDRRCAPARRAQPGGGAGRRQGMARREPWQAWAAMTERLGFYERALRELIEDGHVERDWRVLVVAGGEVDRAALASAGFTDVTVTNLSEDGDERQDAEALSYADDTFDFAVISAALHHCASPHRALLELYRVGRRGLLALEAPDSALMRAAQ